MFAQVFCYVANLASSKAESEGLPPLCRADFSLIFADGSKISGSLSSGEGSPSDPSGSPFGTPPAQPALVVT